MNIARFKAGIAFLFVLTLIGWVGVRFATVKSQIIFFDNLHWTAGYATGSLLAWFAHFKTKKFSPVIFWTAIGLSLFTMGQIVWNIQVIKNWMPFPGPSDIFFLSTGPLISIGLWQLARMHMNASARRTLVLDTAMLLVGILTASMLTFLPRQGGYTITQVVVMAAYPLGIMLPSCLAFNLLVTLRARMTQYWLKQSFQSLGICSLKLLLKELKPESRLIS